MRMKVVNIAGPLLTLPLIPPPLHHALSHEDSALCKGIVEGSYDSWPRFLETAPIHAYNTIGPRRRKEKFGIELVERYTYPSFVKK